MDKKNLDLIKKALKEKKPAYFSAEGLDVIFQTNLLDVSNTQVLFENTVTPEYITRVAESKSFFLQIMMVKFQTESISTDGCHIIFPLKGTSIIKETRTSERFTFSQSDNVICEILNPFDGQTKLKRNVLDMSAEGISIQTPYESKLFKPGVKFPDISITIDNKAHQKTAGVIIYNKKLMNIKGQTQLQVGIKFDT